MYLEYNPKLFNPLYWHLMPALRDENIRYIFIEGGSSASKTYTVCQALLTDQLEYNYASIVFRRFHIDIKDSVYSSFKSAANSLELTNHGLYVFQEDVIKSTVNQSRIRFRGLDNEENIKGIEDFNVVYNNEWSQLLEKHFQQQRKRLRGRPNQKFICDWNPISSKLWQYEKWIDLDVWEDLPLGIEAPAKYSSLDADYSFKRINKKGDTLWIKITYRDNFWIVGRPDGKGGYLDQHTLDDFELDRLRSPNMYRIYANGERGIMRTGGEFWKQFDETKHVSALKPDLNTTIHLTLDNNVNPYVTVGVWQIVLKELRQVYELPCRTPNNNAPKAAIATAEWLKKIGYKNVVYVYGDPSAQSRSTIDENNSSFFEKYIGVLKSCGFVVINRVSRSAPQVALSAAFVNEIYENGIEGYTIAISDSCKVSIDDYATVKEDKDGRMLKDKVKDKETHVTYEPHGHFSDTKRYFIIKILEPEFKRFRERKPNNSRTWAGAFA